MILLLSKGSDNMVHTEVYYPKDIYLGKLNFVKNEQGKVNYETDKKYSAFRKDGNRNSYELLMRSRREKNQVVEDRMSELVVPLKPNQQCFIDDLIPVTTYLDYHSSNITMKEIGSCIAKADRAHTYQKRI